MILALITLVIALTISAVAAYYSIIGLIAIFSAAAIPIAVMGIVLEAGKLITASWLYQNWKSVPALLKGYLCSAVFILMFITSMGIFGFLSKAHIEQTTIASDNTLEIELLQSSIERELTGIGRAENQLNLLDNALERYMELGAVTKGLNARKEQQGERNELSKTITESTQTIATLTKNLSKRLKEQINIAAEVGPIRYIAELFYGESTQAILEDAVRWVIILLVLVFDPLAVLLLIAANISFTQINRAKKRTNRKDPPKNSVKTKRTSAGQGIVRVTESAGNIETHRYE